MTGVCIGCNQYMTVYNCRVRKSGKKYKCNTLMCPKNGKFLNAPPHAVCKSKPSNVVPLLDLKNYCLDISNCCYSWRTPHHVRHSDYGKIGLKDYFPENCNITSLMSCIQFGLLLDFRTIGCPQCGSRDITLIKTSTSYKLQWRCTACRRQGLSKASFLWSVTKGSIFFSCQCLSSLTNLAEMTYSILHTEVTNIKQGSKFANQRQTIGYIFQKFRQLGMKWNIIHPPEMHGHFEFDELILIGAKRGSLNGRGRKRKTQVWGLNMYCVTTGHVSIGVSESRNGNTIGMFVLKHIPNDQDSDKIQVLCSDSWSGTKSNDFNNIPGFNIRHEMVNHENEWVNRSGFHSQNVERKNLDLRVQALNSNTGLNISTVAEHCQFYQFLHNSAATLGLQHKFVGTRWIAFCDAVKEIQQKEWLEKKTIQIPLIYDDMLVDNLEESLCPGVYGLTEESIKEFAERVCPDLSFLNGWFIISQDKIHQSNIEPNGVISGSVWSQDATLKNTNKKITDTNKPYTCQIKFRDCSDPRLLLKPSNVTIVCENHGCKGTKTISSHIMGCQHAIALLLQRKERKLNPQRNIYLNTPNDYSHQKPTSNETLEYKGFERIMAVRIDHRTAEEEFLLKWDKTNSIQYKNARMNSKHMTWVKSSDMYCKGKRATNDTEYSARDHYDSTLNALKFTYLPRKCGY